MTSKKGQTQDTGSISSDASDGSELIPAEVQANIRHDDHAPTRDVAVPGTTVDDEGLINNFATEPKAYPSTYPSPRKQRQYLFLGAAAIVFVAVLVASAFSVS